MSSETGFDILKIMEMLPHRYPFLLIDRIVAMSTSMTASAGTIGAVDGAIASRRANMDKLRARKRV